VESSVIQGVIESPRKGSARAAQWPADPVAKVFLYVPAIKVSRSASVGQAASSSSGTSAHCSGKSTAMLAR